MRREAQAAKRKEKEERLRKEAAEEREKKESLRVVRLYDGAPRGRDAVAVVLAASRGLRSPQFKKPGLAGVSHVDGKRIDSNYTEEIECLPGEHRIGVLLQFRPDNVPAGTLAVNSNHIQKIVSLKAGSLYQIRFDPARHDVQITEIERK